MYGGHGTIVGPGSTMPPADKKDDKKDGAKTGSIEPNRARLTVEVPADAKLFIDDQPMKTTSAVRHFRTPELVAGQQYYYILKVEVARSGVTHSETKRVTLKAGDQINASFTEESIAAAARTNSSARK